MIDAEADGGVVLLADAQEGHQARANLCQLGSIFLIGVLQMLEGASHVDVVAGVDAHFLGVEGSDVCHAGIEVHVGYEGCGDAFGAQRGTDVSQVLGFLYALRGKPHVFASRSYDALGLCDARLSVVGRRGSHRLYAYGVGASQRGVAYVHHRRLSSLIAGLWHRHQLHLKG